MRLEADGIYLAKSIDGVYDSDPKTNPAAVKYDEVSIAEVIEKKLAVVDLTASILCMENQMPMYVFGLNQENSIVNALTGEFSGTKVTVSERKKGIGRVMDERLVQYDEKMQKTMNNLGEEFGSIRAGRANPHVLDKLRVDYYGTPTPIQQVANVECAGTAHDSDSAVGGFYGAGD